MKASIFFLLFLNTVLVRAQSYTVETVPNNKLVTGSYVSNPDNIIRTETVTTIDSVLATLEYQSTAQVAVVLLNSIGDMDPFDFAQELFDSWGIGKAQTDNGLLILLVKDKPTIRFHTGDGLEGVLPDAVCKRIQMEKMVPYFREDNYDEAMLQGVIAVSDILSDPESREVVAGSESSEELPLYNLTVWVILLWVVIVLITFVVKNKRKTFTVPAKPGKTPQARFTRSGWVLWYVVIPVILMVVFSIADSAAGFFGSMYAWTGAGLLIRRKLIDQEAARWALKKEYQAVYNFYQQERGTFSAMRFLFPVPFAFMYGRFKKRMQFFRDHPRNCKQCGKPLAKLDEISDDVFLSKAQLLEEGLKSVDYDVWKCSACNAADMLTYINPSSKFLECPGCKVRSYFRVSDSVIRAATTSSEGEGEEIHSCKFCGERNVRRYSIARIQRSSSSGSSSSGGSWGGGSSGGGGASSSW